MNSQSNTNQEVLAGLVERVTFHNESNGFCVLRAKARGHRELVTVVGHAASIAAGEWITASGEWVTDRWHGQQFRARFLRTSAPTSVDGIQRYLASGMIHGIGPVYARKLVGAFGERVFDVIEAEPQRLLEVDGIGPVRAERISSAWSEQKVIREIMVFLHHHGVGTARAVRIFKTYGADAVQVMSEDPYRLAADIRGIGFKTADAIAGRLGIARTAVVRLRAGISYALTEAMHDGHCGLPTDDLVELARGLLEVPREMIRTVLPLELTAGTVVRDRVGASECVFLAGLYRAERTIAERLLTVRSGPLPWSSIDAHRAIPWVEKRTGLRLATSQRSAVALALRSKVLVMTGGPGVGKTTILRAILQILAAKGVAPLLCAPTGRAAKRMSEATGLTAKTIHRLLEVDPKVGGFRRASHNPLDGDLLVVDEASMVDVLLMQALLRALPDRAALLLIGDVNQLPSVGPGQVLADVIASDAVAKVTSDRGLPSVHRQPNCRQRSPDQSRRVSELEQAGGRQRFLFYRSRQPGAGAGADHRTGQSSHPASVQPRSDPRHSGALPDEPGQRRCAVLNHCAAIRAESGEGALYRTLWLVLCGQRQGDAGRKRLRQGRIQRRYRLCARG